jgi:hypothetical protein
LENLVKGHNGQLFGPHPKVDITELRDCPAKDTEGLALEQGGIRGEIVLVLPTSAYHCLQADINRPYHLQYAFGTGSTPVEIPNLQWAIREGAVGNLAITQMEGKIYRLETGTSRPDGMKSITAFGTKTYSDLPLIRLTSNALKFEISNEMASSSSPYYFRIQIDQARVDAYSDVSTATSLCFNFKFNLDCAAAAARLKNPPPDVKLPAKESNNKPVVASDQSKTTQSPQEAPARK